jgi:hypothetical protein
MRQTTRGEVMFITASANANATFRLVPADSRAAKMAMDRRTVTDRKGFAWNVGTTLGREPIAWRRFSG